MEKQVSPGALCQILDLRLLIARAGEQDCLAWWDGHALGEQGQWVLARLYPRYAIYAGARLAIEAAAMVHAKIIGHRSAVTLFNLGADLDARVMRQLDLRRMDDAPLTIVPPIRSGSELQARLSQTVALTDDDLAVVRSALVNGSLVELEAVTETDLWSGRKLKAIVHRLAAAYTLSEPGHLVVPYYRLEE